MSTDSFMANEGNVSNKRNRDSVREPKVSRPKINPEPGLGSRTPKKKKYELTDDDINSLFTEIDQHNDSSDVDEKLSDGSFFAIAELHDAYNNGDNQEQKRIHKMYNTAYSKMYNYWNNVLKRKNPPTLTNKEVAELKNAAKVFSFFLFFFNLKEEKNSNANRSWSSKTNNRIFTFNIKS